VPALNSTWRPCGADASFFVEKDFGARGGAAASSVHAWVNARCHADCRMYVVGRTTGQVGSAIKP
jgi:hypothetical protein